MQFWKFANFTWLLLSTLSHAQLTYTHRIWFLQLTLTTAALLSFVLTWILIVIPFCFCHAQVDNPAVALHRPHKVYAIPLTDKIIFIF